MQTIYGVTSGENIVQAFTEENTTEANFHQSINNAAILTFTTTEPLKDGVRFFLTKDPINDYKHEEFMYFEITDQDFDGYEYSYRAEEYAYHDLDTMGYVKKVYTQGKWTTRTLLESIVYNDVEPKGVARTKWEIIDNDLTLPTTWAGEGNTYTLWYNTPLRGIEKFIEYFGGEIRFYVTIFNNKISRHYLEIYEKRGRETGKRYESNSNLISLTNKAEYDNRYEYIIPLGEGGGTSGDEQKHNTPNGFNNYITLEGLEVGKSTDKWYKPKSQMYISLANDKNAYPLKSQPKGLQNNPRIKPVTFEEVKSKQALFNKAIEWLENNQGVAWSYSASVLDIGESQVGDTIAIIDERSGISSYVRVHDIDYDMIDPENTGVHFGSNWGYENDEAITDMLNTATAARHDTIALIDTAIRQSNGKNTNYYGKNEPADPTAGDLWYKQAGDETYLMIFKDGQWVELVSTRTQKVIADAVDEATSEANSYADSLNATQASEAAAFQSEANAALSEAAAERNSLSIQADTMLSGANSYADSMAGSAAAYGKAQASNVLSQAQSELSVAKQQLGSEVSKAQSDIIATNKELAGKVSQTDFDKTTGDLSTKYGQVKATADSVKTDVAKYKETNDKKVSGNAASIATMSDQITSKVSKTDFDKKTGELNGKFTQQKQTVDSISQTVTELQAKVNSQGQVNQLMNTEFTPDLEGWSLSTVNGGNAPYKSGFDKNAQANMVGFNTTNAPTNSLATLQQDVLIGNAGGGFVSLSWQSLAPTFANYANLWVRFYDADNKQLDEQVKQWTPQKSDGSIVGGLWTRQKFEGIAIPSGSVKISVFFQAREGIRAYLVRPMLVFSKTIGDYVQGNYNNNSRVSALEVGLKGITGLVNDPKNGLSATAALAANGLSVATKAQNDATTAIQTAKGVQTKVEQMGGINLLVNTEFNPDLEGWDTSATSSGSRAPYRSYWQNDIQATVVGFNTIDGDDSSYSRFRQDVQLSSTPGAGKKISLSWYSFANQMAFYNNIWLRFYDSDGKSISTNTTNWADTNGKTPSGQNSWNVQNKWEGIDVPDTAVMVNVSFEAREGTSAYLAHPMLVMGSTIGDYVPGNYNNNNSLESTRTQLAGQIADEIKDRTTGDKSVVTQMTGLIDQRVASVEKGYQSAITQSANGILASVSMPNKLLNTEFTPDLDGWDIGSTNSDTSKPYKSYSHDGSNLVAFDTRKNPSNTRATMAQTIPLGSSTSIVSVSWHARFQEDTNYSRVHVYGLDENKAQISDDWKDLNVTHTNVFSDGKFENIILPDKARYVRVVFMVREGAYGFIGKPMLVLNSSVGTYMPGSYSGMNTSTVLELFKDNWALGIADNSGKLISGINGDTSGTVIQGKKLVINSDTTINGKAFIDGSVIKNASIGTAQIGKAAVGSAQIINVDVSKISGNIANFVTGNINRLNAHVLYGDTGHLGTTDTGRVINKQDNHLQLAAKNMYDEKTNRAQLELLSWSNDIDEALRGSLTYYGNPRTPGGAYGIRLKNNQILAIDEGRHSKHLYLSPYAGGQVRIVSRDQSKYYDICASNFKVSSQRKYKSNITDLDDNALEIVKNTKVHKYTKNGVSEIGVIADEADERLLSDDGKFINIYDYTSILYKAVQELTEKVEELQNERPNDY